MVPHLIRALEHLQRQKDMLISSHTHTHVYSLGEKVIKMLKSPTEISNKHYIHLG